MIGRRYRYSTAALRDMVAIGFREWRRRKMTPRFECFSRSEAITVKAICMARYPAMDFYLTWHGWGDKRGIPPLIIT